MEPPIRVGQAGTVTRVGTETKAHGREDHRATRGGTTRPIKAGTHKLTTMVGPLTAGDRDLTTLETTMVRATAAVP